MGPNLGVLSFQERRGTPLGSYPSKVNGALEDSGPVMGPSKTQALVGPLRFAPGPWKISLASQGQRLIPCLTFLPRAVYGTFLAVNGHAREARLDHDRAFVSI